MVFLLMSLKWGKLEGGDLRRNLICELLSLSLSVVFPSCMRGLSTWSCCTCAVKRGVLLNIPSAEKAGKKNNDTGLKVPHSSLVGSS